MGVAPQSNKTITRCGLGEAALREDNMYRGWYERFVLLFGVLCLVVIGGVSLDSSLGIGQKSAVIVTVMAMAAWFWFVGQWHIIRSDLHAIIYLLGNIVGIVICIRIWDTSALLLFAMYWFGFAYLYTKYALIYALVLTISTQWAFGTINSDVGFNKGTFAGIGMLIVLLGFSAMMARYIEAFQNEAERNKALVDELKRTQQSLIERERESGIEEEHRRMAGEIHDTIAQQFASVITNLRAARELESSEPHLTKQHLELAFTAAQQGLKDSRAMLSTMQPDVLLGRSLSDVIRAVVDEWSIAPEITISLITEGTPTQLDRTHESLLVRALQESLRNISKHAKATEVEVRNTWLEDEVLMDVSDNGIGFDPSTVQAGENGYQLGLATMQSRVESAGGTFALESSPGDGTSITISFPTGGSS